MPKRTLALLALLQAVGCERGPLESPGASESLLTTIQRDVAAGDVSEIAYYNEHYRPVEADYWAKIAGWMMQDYIERRDVLNRPAVRILDLGCGYGTLLALATSVYGAAGVCADLVPYVQPAFRKKYNISFVRTDIEREPLPDPGAFDVIVMTEVLEHLNFDPVPTLKKIWEALADDGSFFLSTPDADGGWGRTTEYYESLDDLPPVDPEAEWINAHIWHYSRAELVQVLRDAGFEIERLDHTEGVVGRHFNVWARKPRAVGASEMQNPG